MRTRIVLVCTALYVACIAASVGQSQDGSEDRFYSAIRANDLRQIKALLDEGISANAEGTDGITPLMLAAETGLESQFAKSSLGVFPKLLRMT